MSKSGEKLIDAVREAVDVAKGKAPAARIYGPTPRLIALKDVLARVETATGSDREIDVSVACVMPDRENSRRRPSKVPGRVCSTYLTGRTGTWVAPHYTSSLDACLALAERVLPANADWQLCKGGGCTIIYGNTPDGFDILDTGVQSAPTPALGFLAATLRALIAIEEKGSAG